MCLYALCGKSTLLLSTVDSQLEAVQQRVRTVEGRIVKAKQDLAEAKQANNNEGEKSMFDLLLSLYHQALSLQQEKNILLRGQASGNTASSSDLLAYLCFHHVALHSVNDSILGCCFTHDPKGMLPRLPQLWAEKTDSGMKLCALCMHLALCHLSFSLHELSMSWLCNAVFILLGVLGKHKS